MKDKFQGNLEEHDLLIFMPQQGFNDPYFLVGVKCEVRSVLPVADVIELVMTANFFQNINN